MQVNVRDLVYCSEQFIDKWGMIVPANEVGVVLEVHDIDHHCLVDFPTSGLTKVPTYLLDKVPLDKKPSDLTAEEFISGVSSNKRGNPEASSTGSLRFNSGKPQCNEISPSFLLDMGAVLEKSRQKYPRGNWEKGNNYSVPYDSLMRHLLSWQSGEKYDKESGLPHLAHAALNLMMLHYYEEHYPEFDDRIFKKKDEK